MIPSTTQRVPEHTAAHVNERIRRQTDARVARTAAGGPSAVDRRLHELDREWDIERTLEANAAALAATGAALALLVDRRFALLPLVVGGFLFQHAVRGGAHRSRSSAASASAPKPRSTRSGRP